MSHRCSSVLVRCINFRLQGPIGRWLDDQGLVGDCDLVSKAGAVKDIVAGGTSVMADIDIAVSLHMITRVILMNHTDCGAYGGRQSDDDARHLDQIKQAKAIVLAKYPNLEIWIILADIMESGEVRFLRAD